MGIPRAAIEGTQIPYDLIMKYAAHDPPELVFDPHRKRSPLVLRSQITYFGFELGREEEPIETFPPELAPLARQKIAESLARFEARHPAVKRNRAAIEEIRDVYRRSGGQTPRLSLAELTAVYAKLLEGVSSLDELRAAPLVIDPDTIVPRDVRERWLALPDSTSVRNHDVLIEYDVEDGIGGVARLRLPEKMARTLHESELPTLDRPLRFAVHRGARGSVRGASLDELQELLSRPWMPDEVEREREPERVRDRSRENGPARRGERQHGGPPRSGGNNRGGGGPGRRRRRSR
jgi:ATP-dependent helicase HrpA